MLDLNEVKLWLRLEPSDTTEDAILQSIVTSAEEYLRNALTSWIDPQKNPQAKILAMALVADMYENRETTANIQFAAQLSGMRPTLQSLLTQLRFSYPQIETPCFPDITVGTEIELKLFARGGDRPYEWQIIAGALPAGLVLDQYAGTISGTPIAAGRSAFTIEVKDQAGRTSSRPLSITVVDPA